MSRRVLSEVVRLVEPEYNVGAIERRKDIPTLDLYHASRSQKD